jgi:hypothetical protein
VLKEPQLLQPQEQEQEQYKKIPYFINKSCTCQNSAPRTNGSSKTSTEEQKTRKNKQMLV